LAKREQKAVKGLVAPVESAAPRDRGVGRPGPAGPALRDRRRDTGSKALNTKGKRNRLA
jgi:hypothetical protein